MIESIEGLSGFLASNSTHSRTMLIKQADDKTNDIDTLRTLLNHPAATPDTKKRIEVEIRNMSSGVRGEQDAAYEIGFHYDPSKNWAVIHECRVE